MPFVNLPWLNTGPELFLQALKAGTDAGLAQERNRLEGASQGLQMHLGNARNETEREKIRQTGELAKSKLAQLNDSLALRAQLGEGRLDETERHHQAAEGILNGRNSLLRDRLDFTSANAEENRKLLEQRLEIAKQNANSITERLELSKQLAELKANKPEKLDGPMIEVAGSKVRADDPRLQDLLNTPQERVTTNTHWFRPDEVTTNSALPETGDITTNQLLRAFAPKSLTESLSRPSANRFRIISAE